ncbi:hypothetical protein Fcan01_06688 [Folsomia candida]|uniref:Uncharacterized protein n=1 Tax=Folsomia candida TaxID=158441 RepID=A0A226EKC6_FOLCA|nr:hypothetical protein Fcan01_06688 [Folsomia candida]
MFILNKTRLQSCASFVVWVLGICFLLTLFSPCASGNKISPEENDTGRFLGFLKPKNEYTDINFGLQVPVPQVDIPYPIFKIGYQDILPWKTWITLNPVHIAKKLWKLVWLGVEVASSIIHIIWNTVDIFKLWGAFHTIHKADLKHPGWSSTSDFFDNPDDWR